MDYEALEMLCFEKGTTPTAVAFSLGLSKGNVSSWRKGCNPSINVLKQLSYALGCSVDYLLGLDMKPNRKSLSPGLPEDKQMLLNFYDSLPAFEQGRLLGYAERMAQEHGKTLSGTNIG